MRTSMFERYGGFSKVRGIVSDFYDKILDSPSLAKYFAGSDMRRLIDHQTKFVASLMGGPASYTNQQLARVHADLQIDAESYGEVVDLLTESLEDHGVEAADIALIREDVMSRRAHIVTVR